MIGIDVHQRYETRDPRDEGRIVQVVAKPLPLPTDNGQEWIVRTITNPNNPRLGGAPFPGIRGKPRERLQEGKSVSRSYWERRSDGVVYSTTSYRSISNVLPEVLMRRESDGKTHWVTWRGLSRKYREVPEPPRSF